MPYTTQVGQYGSLPQNVIDGRDAITQFYVDPEDLNTYFRAQLTDYSSDKPLFASEAARDGTTLATDSINSRYGGTRSGGVMPDAPDLFLGFTDRDPRGHNTGPDMALVRPQSESRASGFAARLNRDTDNSISEREKRPQVLMEQLRDRLGEVRDRMLWFSSSKGNFTAKQTRRTDESVVAQQIVSGRDCEVSDAARSNFASVLSRVVGLGWLQTGDHIVKVGGDGQVRDRCGISRADRVGVSLNTMQTPESRIAAVMATLAAPQDATRAKLLAEAAQRAEESMTATGQTARQLGPTDQTHRNAQATARETDAETARAIQAVRALARTLRETNGTQDTSDATAVRARDAAVARTDPHASRNTSVMGFIDALQDRTRSAISQLPVAGVRDAIANIAETAQYAARTVAPVQLSRGPNQQEALTSAHRGDSHVAVSGGVRGPDRRNNQLSRGGPTTTADFGGAGRASRGMGDKGMLQYVEKSYAATSAFES